MKYNYVMNLIRNTQLGVLVILLLIGFTACNVSKEQDNIKKETSKLAINNASDKTSTDKPKTEDRAIGYAKFKKMSVEERWHVLSPSRRNQLRGEPDLYPYFKPMIAKYPDIEEMSARDPAIPVEESPVNPYAQYEFKTFTAEKSVEQRWNEFSEKRKTYMKAHPEKYPEFKKYLEN